MKRSSRAADFDFEGRFSPAGRSLPTPRKELKMKLTKENENKHFFKLTCDVKSSQQTLKVKM